MALSDLLNQTCTLEPLLGRDDFDKTTWGTAVTGIACRVEGASETFRRADDEVVVVSKKIWLLPDTVVDEDSRLTLADGSQPEIIHVEEMPDRDGNTFYIKLMTGAR
jgi:hypothetical protein